MGKSDRQYRLSHDLRFKLIKSLPNATSSRLCAAMPAPIASAASMTIHAMDSCSKEKALRISLARMAASATGVMVPKSTFGYGPDCSHSWRAK